MQLLQTRTPHHGGHPAVPDVAAVRCSRAIATLSELPTVASYMHKVMPLLDRLRTGSGGLAIP